MPYVPFFHYLPAIAKLETRVLTLPSSKNKFGLPMGEYAFLEFFCDECDCRRVFFNVIKSGISEPVAVISWGWETEKFYINWFGRNDKVAVKEMMGSRLNLWSKQSAIADSVLELFNSELLNNESYTLRVKKHYNLFRNVLKRMNEGNHKRM